MSPLRRVLTAADQPALERFLSAHRDSSMFLRSNLRQVGFGYSGQRYQAEYVGSVGSPGEILAVVAHAWTGFLLVQAPVATAEIEALARAVVVQSGRRVKGISGPWAQVTVAQRALGIGDERLIKSGHEKLFALELERITLPASLADGTLSCERVTERTFDAVVKQRTDFKIEALGESPTPTRVAESREEARHAVLEGRYFVLLEGTTPVASCVFNAMLPDVVQLGAVFTPPALRNRGLARALTAGCLRLAQQDGVTRAVLFTGDDNVAAQRAYQSIGFEPVGEFGLLLFD